MNIFISQSGNLSKEIAEVFSEWIKSFLKNINVFVSSSEIDYGSEWFQKIQKSLREADFAMSILTKENHSKPWINYEYGALVEILKNKGNNAIPILFGVDVKELNGEPIQQHQCIVWPDKKKIIRLFSVNDFKYNELEIKINNLLNKTESNPNPFLNFLQIETNRRLNLKQKEKEEKRKNEEIEKAIDEAVKRFEEYNKR
jgi:hypothetical protein